MRRWIHLAMFALPLAALGCGKTTSREDNSGNTNWLKPCNTDAECGGLSCSCGVCRDPSEACAEPPETTPGGTAGTGQTRDPEIQPGAPSPNVIAERRDEEALATDMAVDGDGNFTLVGGTAPVGADLQILYPAFWMAKLNDQGDVLDQYRDYPALGEINTARSVVLTSTGTIALSTTYDGADSPFLRYFDDFSGPSHTWSSLPGYTTLRSDGAGGVFAVGSRRVNDLGAPRPYNVAWMGRYQRYIQVDDAATLTWQQERQGLEGSISEIRVAASDSAGNLLVGGTIGTAADNNSGVPYMARLDVDGNFVWEQQNTLLSVQPCITTAVAFTADGGSLAATGCPPFYVEKFKATGEGDGGWSLDQAATALLGLSDGGTAVATGGGVAKLQRFDADHRLVWEKTDKDCTAYIRLIETSTALVALAQCQRGYALSWLTSP